MFYQVSVRALMGGPTLQTSSVFVKVTLTVLKVPFTAIGLLHFMLPVLACHAIPANLASWVAQRSQSELKCFSCLQQQCCKFHNLQTALAFGLTSQAERRWFYMSAARSFGWPTWRKWVMELGLKRWSHAGHLTSWSHVILYVCTTTPVQIT